MMPRCLIARFAMLWLVGIALPAELHARPVTLAWDQNLEPDIAGYKLHYGTQSGVYQVTVNVGKRTDWTFQLAENQTYYFAVRAYNNAGFESPLSTEVSTFVKPALPGSEHRDFNGDGSADILFEHTDGRLAVWMMDGAWRITGQVVDRRPADVNWNVVGTADLDGNNGADIVWQHLDGRLAAWLMNGTTLLQGVTIDGGRQPDPSWQVKAIVDVNRDSHSDLVFQHNDGRLEAWFMNGTAVVQIAPMTPTEADTQWKIAGAADVAGVATLFWQHEDGRLQAGSLNGTTLLQSAPLTPARLADSNWKIGAVTDVDNDAVPDLLWQHADSRVAVWWMNGLSLARSYVFPALSDTQWKLVGP